MKKFLLMLVFFVGSLTATQAQSIQWFKATSFSYRYINDYGYWTNWSKWDKCNINIKFELDNDFIVIYSSKTQVYKVIQLVDSPYDDSGTSIRFSVVDGEGDYGYIRLRVENNQNSQIYVDFANISWCYNVVRTK
ncbi:MAG: hypothetical protein IKT40_12070 [Bacilli bacterium]|nr:hypothetical protein [Bacilli bacterium]